MPVLPFMEVSAIPYFSWAANVLCILELNTPGTLCEKDSSSKEKKLLDQNSYFHFVFLQALYLR